MLYEFKSGTSFGRSPHGERGLKLKSSSFLKKASTGRSPHGERGLKYLYQWCKYLHRPCRSPHGERGLKYKVCKRFRYIVWSLSSRRAWIEILNNFMLFYSNLLVALLTESVD